MRRSLVGILTVVVLTASGCASMDGAMAEKKPLYDRLGGQNAIRAVVDDFIGNVAADSRINKRFANADIPRPKTKLVEQICEATGRPCKYSGVSMLDAHRGMNITEPEFTALVEDLVKSLDRQATRGREDRAADRARRDEAADRGAVRAIPGIGGRRAAGPARLRRCYSGAVRWRPEKHGFDEAFDADGTPRRHYEPLIAALESFTHAEIDRRERLQRLSLIDQGVTFTVYGEKDGVERIFPFDFVPRIIPADEWKRVETGLVQRVTALNLFIQDVYHEQKCLKDGVIPPELVLSRAEYKRELLGVLPARGIFTHVVGVDIIRDGRGEYRVLEDNCRCPSGVSYVLENRSVLHRVFPELFTYYPVHPIKHYPSLLRETLVHAAPRSSENPVVVVLSPGLYNSAFFEHSFLAREMGAVLVEGRDLIVEDNHVFMRTTSGRQRVDVIYRRIDDDFLDPLTFRRDSLLGVPGLVNAYRDGNVALANAPGAGVADDKAVYAFMPALVRYYLDEDPLLPQVDTYVGFRRDDFAFMRENLAALVVKTTGGSGGYGMLMGPFATKKEIETYAAQMRKNPSGYVAQPLIELSAHPTYMEGAFAARRIDLRPFVLYGESVRVLPGGLTRVALREGSYVVNSSQGGGSKDTWVLATRHA